MDTVISDDGTTIAFDRCGDGPPVIPVGRCPSAPGDRPAEVLATVLRGFFTG